MSSLFRLKIIIFFISIFISCTTDSQEIQYSDVKHSIGLFGGSYTRASGSEIVINMWKDSLSFDVINYGEHGYGFSSLQGSIQTSVENADILDVYVLWASTNDFMYNRDVGSVNDYSANDGYNESKRITQCGGINYCIRKLREKNPSCKIIFISSIPVFTIPAGYLTDSCNVTGYSFYDYVKGQEECCLMQNVAFLNLFDSGLFTVDNYRDYFLPNDIHLNSAGYTLIANPIFSYISSIINGNEACMESVIDNIQEYRKPVKYIQNKKLIIENNGRKFFL